jgi:hypothetical protein
VVSDLLSWSSFRRVGSPASFLLSIFISSWSFSDSSRPLRLKTNWSDIPIPIVIRPITPGIKLRTVVPSPAAVVTVDTAAAVFGLCATFTAC